MSAEEWRTVAVAPDYEVSNLGRVKSHKPKSGVRILRPCVNSLGYHNQTLFVAGRPIFTTAHVLVMAAFVGPRPDGMDIRHIDGDPSNNALGNLAYGTRSENALDMVRHGRSQNAEKTACPADHPYDAANTYVDPKGFRHCRKCAAERRRARSAA